MQYLHLKLKLSALFGCAAEMRHSHLPIVCLAKPLKVYPRQQGFSLLEMLVVIFLLGIVMVGTTTILVDNGDIQRQEETERRWDALRKSIVGDSSLIMNGSPYMQGYVMDMGRLPVSVAELISRRVTYDHDNNNSTPEILLPFDHDASSSTADITVSQPNWASLNLYTPNTGFTATLNGGWRGPYQYTGGSAVYRDGWNNNDSDTNRDIFNFGWQVTVSGTYPSTTDFAVHSLGADNQANGNDFEADYPSSPLQLMVSENQWTLSTAPISFNVFYSTAIVSGTKPADIGGSPHELELRIYRYVDNGDDVIDLNDLLTIEADDLITLAIGDTSAPLQTITPPTNVPVGRFAAVIWCTLNTPATTDDVVYDGDCSGTPSDPVDHSPVYFTLTSNTPQVSIRWNLP